MMRTTESSSQLGGELLVAAAAGGALVVLVELAPRAQCCVTHGAREVVHTPSFVQSREHIASNHLVAHITQVSE